MKTGLLSRTAGYASLVWNARTARRAADVVVRENARRHLAERMGKLRGLPQKIGQILSMSNASASGDSDHSSAFSELSDNAEAIPLDEVRTILERTWNRPIEEVLRKIDTDGHAASLGQVHRAVLHDGRAVAVKIAYPGIREAVTTDLRALGLLSAPFGDLRRGFDLHAYREEIARDLSEELDYRRELSNQTRFGEIAVTMEGLIVPRVVDALSTENVLVSEWEEGETIDDAIAWPTADRAELARRMLRQFLLALFDHGFVHSDPHPGNYRFRLDPTRGPSVVLYDFGSVFTLSEDQRLLLLRLITQSAARKSDPLALLSALGFRRELLEPIQSKLPAVCAILFEPFSQQGKFDLAQWHRSERLNDVLGNYRWNFRMAGPASLILLMRAFHGLVYYLERLGQPVSWERELAPVIERNTDRLAAAPVLPSSSPQATFEALAKHLRIDVHRDGERKVALTLSATAVEDLDQLMNDEVKLRIRERGIDLHAIVRETRHAGYAPRELFHVQEPGENRQIRVWLE